MGTAGKRRQEMRKFVVYLASVLLVLSAGCQRRELTYTYPYCTFKVAVDWSAVKQVPPGFTMMFFPVEGGEPVSVSSNSIHLAEASLRAGTYNVIMFSQSPGEFGQLDFRGLENYGTAEVLGVPDADKWYTPKIYDAKPMKEPEPFAVDCYEGLEITFEMVENSILHRMEGIEEPVLLNLAPKPVTLNAKLIISVDGIHNAKSAVAAITGFSEGLKMTSGTPTETSVIYHLESWSKKVDENDRKNGDIITNFSIFGTPSECLDSDDIRLDLAVLLVDNKTQKHWNFDVGDKVRFITDPDGKAVTVEIVMDNPIYLQDVEPADGGGGGFDASVDDWGNEQIYDIPVGGEDK